MADTNTLYNTIEQYALEKDLPNTLIALPLIRKHLKDIVRRTFSNEQKDATSLHHCLEATMILINLHIGYDRDNEDILLASMLCHDMLENVAFPDNGNELVIYYHLDPRILEVIRLLTRPSEMTNENLFHYYQNIQNNQIAVLVALADRSNLVEALSSLSISEARHFVREMRTFLLPICVYAKDYYQDLVMPLTILMEKIRCLIDVTDVISSRYQKREMAYTNEILSIMEQNARIRGMIRQLENGEI